MARNATDRPRDNDASPSVEVAQLRDSNILYGANVHFGRTVFRQPLVIGSLDGVTSASCGTDFAAKYLDWLSSFRCRIYRPPLDELKSGLSSKGGVAIEQLVFQAMLALDMSLRFRMRRYAPLEYADILREGDRVVFVWDTSEPGISRRAGLAAIAGFGDLLPDRLRRIWPDDDRGYAYRLQDVEARAERLRWSTTTGVLALASRHRRLPCQPLTDTYLRIGYGMHQVMTYASTRHLTASTVPQSRHGSTYLNRLRHIGLPVSKRTSRVASDFEAARRLCRFLLVGGRVVSVLEASHEDTSHGGVTTYRDVTEKIHADHCALVAYAGRHLGLGVVGIDITLRDLSLPPVRSRARIVGVTPRPNLEPHSFPDAGAQRDVGTPILDLIFPTDIPATLPTAVVYGSRGAVVIADDLAGLLRGGGHATGVAAPSRATVDGKPVDSGSLGVRGAVRYLRDDSRVDTLVAVMSPRRIARHGLILENCATAAVLPRTERDDAEKYERCLAGLLRAVTGALVVDSDAAGASDIVDRVPSQRIILFTTSSGTSLTRRHVAAGGRALVVTGANGDRRIVLLESAGEVAKFAFSSMWGAPGTPDDKHLRRRLYALGLAAGLGLVPGDIEKAAVRRAYLRA